MARRTLPKSRRQYGVSTPARDLVRELPGVKTGKFPGRIEPCLPELRDGPPHTEQWLHEIKHDGYRLQVHLTATGGKAYTRRGNDWTPRFKRVLAGLGLIEARTVILDGEAVVESETGHSDFQALEEELGAKRSERLTYHAFDLLHLDGFDLRGCTLVDRKRALFELIGESKGAIRFVEHLEGDGRTIYRQACKRELEGVVSKLANSTYESGRSNRWVKVTCRQRDTFAVVGWAEKNGKFDGLYLGREEKAIWSTRARSRTASTTRAQSE